MEATTTRNSFDNQVDSYLGFLKNEYAVAGVSLFLILYAGIIAPKLPANILQWFDNWVVQVALFFAIVYISNKNATVALITAVAVLVTLMVASNQITLRSATAAATAEKFSSCSCTSDVDDSDLIAENTMEYDELEDHQIPVQESGDVEGVLDENVEEHDAEMSGITHAVSGGATTSRGGPKMPSTMEPDYPSHRRHAGEQEMVQESDDSESEISESPSGTIGVEAEQMDDESSGSALDDSGPMGAKHGNASHAEEESVPNTAEEAVRVAVETVTTQVERETGETVPEEVKEEVTEEVASKVATIARRRPVGEFDVISVCREVYRRHL